MENGNLKAYLNHRNKMGQDHIAVQVANGMIYLGEQDYIHCDLRAENILVGEYNTIKIANFHLAQHLNGNKYWSVEEGTRFNVRYTAPEGYTSYGRLSIKSDVWSFGILLWELVTKGSLPYPGMTNQQVREAVPKGYRMPEPYCPEPFYQIMLACWELNDYERPTFNNIRHHLLGETV